MSDKRILVAHPHGFCSGVAHAVSMAEAALAEHGSPIYCLHAIVHNAQVSEALATKGIRFVERLDAVPSGAVLLLPAHGAAPAIYRQARALRLHVIDATCPFVAKVHREVRRFVSEGFSVICIGYRRHEEVIGIVGEAPEQVLVVESEAEARALQAPHPDRMAVVTQTTLSVEMVAGIVQTLRSRFPGLRQSPKEDICYATRNRQEAVRALASQTEEVLVLGSPTSSNSLRLVEVARAAGCQARLLQNRTELANIPLDAVSVLGITSGASTPESFLNDVLEDLRALGFENVVHLPSAADEG